MSHETPALPPQAILSQMISGDRLATAICAAARLGVADRVHDTPTAIEDIAVAIGADTGALYRLMRALAGAGIFAEASEGSFVHTPLSAALRSGVPGSMRRIRAARTLRMRRCCGFDVAIATSRAWMRRRRAAPTDVAPMGTRRCCAPMRRVATPAS